MILNINCKTGMQLFLADNSVDAIVCDPPYELGFMGKTWDSSGVAYDVDMWAEALRVLKPGGHLLAFGGSRTAHRMVCAIEDAGFEVRDSIVWIYGSGFPKSLDVSKAIDKAAGAVREVVGPNPNSRPNMVNVGANVLSPRVDAPITAPATDAARQWEGWGTALKPAHEPICVARKPLIGTVAANVLAHGTGAINIDACRVATTDTYSYPNGRGGSAIHGGGQKVTATAESNALGRWPANLIHDGSDEVLAGFPAQAGAAAPVRGTESSAASTGNVTNERARVAGAFHNDTGSAARFFYCAKASTAERGVGNNHPTVKPIALMRYLVRLVTPPGGLVLDPFTGSGTTAVAAKLEGAQFMGFELSAEFCKIAERRVEAAA